MTAALIPSGAKNRENLHHVPINPAGHPETGSGDGGGRTGALAGQPSARAIPPIGRTRPSHLKLRIAAYSYRDYLTSEQKQGRS